MQQHRTLYQAAALVLIGAIAATALAQNGQASSGTLQPGMTTRPAAPTIYPSPQDVIGAAQRARDAKDWATWVDCLTPEAQKMGVEFTIGIVLMTADEPNPAPADEKEAKGRAAFDAFLSKYKLKGQKPKAGEDPKAFAERLAETVVDKRAFLIEAMTLSPDQSDMKKPELSELRINGEVATGKLVTKDPDGSSMSVDVDFRKISGSWKINSAMNI